MKLTKFDIGAEVISIITKGMYPDPKDALREYIHNGVDAFAKNLTVKVRQDSIVVEDDGIGMNHDVLKKAVRVGISDKNPTKNVGFMGIGIYSSFHLCEKLTIYSRGADDISNKLEMDFGSMKSILNLQKEKRLNNEIKSEELVDLQTLLENCISLTENGELSNDVFPVTGTRVELANIEGEFYTALSGFDEVADYLRNVIPLHFDHAKFDHAAEVENYISTVCQEKNQKFEIINLTLQVNSRLEKLFRPYRNIDFDKIKKPLRPTFFNIESNGEFFGVMWGCLNSVRKKLDNKSLRGFLLKKQGFTIGKRETLVKFFPRGNTFFDRYSGEVIIVNQKILPNASRNDIEYSPLRSLFYEALTRIAGEYDDIGNLFQEHSKADEELATLHEKIKREIGSYNEFEEDSEILINKIVSLKSIHEKLQGRIERKGFSPESEMKARSLVEQVSAFENTLQQRIKILTEHKKKKQADQVSSKVDLAKNVASIEVETKEPLKNYESLYDLLIDLEYNIDDNLKEAIFIIDEMFVQRVAKTKAEYYELLNGLKESVQSEQS
jgi:hypothetical protein